VDRVLEIVVDLARVVADAHLADARQSLQLVLVEDVAAVVVGQIPSVVPRLPEQAGQQRRAARRIVAAALQSRCELRSTTTTRRSGGVNAASSQLRGGTA